MPAIPRAATSARSATPSPDPEHAREHAGDLDRARRRRRSHRRGAVRGDVRLPRRARLHLDDLLVGRERQPVVLGRRRRRGAHGRDDRGRRLPPGRLHPRRIRSMPVSTPATSTVPDDVVALIDVVQYEETSDFPVERGYIWTTCSSVENGNPLFWDDAVAEELTGGTIEGGDFRQVGYTLAGSGACP